MVREDPNERQDEYAGTDGERRAGSSGCQRGSRRRDGERAQTTLDFTVGVTLFLLVITSVFLFIPGTLQPFTEGGQEDIVSANRVADSLTQGKLVDPQTPYILDAGCTVRLFNRTYSSECRYPDSSLEAQLGLNARTFVNVSVRNVSAAGTDELLCWDRANDELVESSESDCDDVLATGDTPPRNTQSSVTARRVVQLDGTDVYLVVRLW